MEYLSLTYCSSILRKETGHADMINPEQKPRKIKRLCTYRPCLNFSTATGPWSLLSKSLINESTINGLFMAERGWVGEKV